ncbi:MAG TPA: hypothetical protein VGC93_12805 [Thermoanaerobaculia bacterium]
MAERERYDLGVLLVHGIGQQGRGDTLVRFGEPIQRWLQRWISQKRQPGSHDPSPIVDARFAPPAGDADAPAHAELRVKATASDDSNTSRWLLAESWWASTFLPPRFADLASWGLQILPWTLSTHFATRARRVLRDLRRARGVLRGLAAGRLLLEILGFLLAVLLFPVFVTLLLLILIIGSLPIPRLRAFAASLQRALSKTVGDSFVLMASPIQEAAIVGKVAQDLLWLVRQGCKQVAVVAHSQGAAISHAAIKKLGPAVFAADPASDSDPMRKILFATVGSGLNKLAEIRSLRSTPEPASVWAAPVGLLLLAVALPEVFTTFRTDDENFFALYAASFGLLFFVLGVAAAWQENRPQADDLALEAVAPWLDFYASADPVPNGRLFDSDEDTKRLMKASQVHNLASPLVDHMSYWRNEDEFLGQLVCALGKHGELPLQRESSLDESRLAVAAERRWWRVQWLAATRLLVGALTAVLALRYWDELPDMTQGAVSALGSILSWVPLVGNLGQLVSQIPLAPQALGSGALLAFGFGVYYALYGVWLLWNRADVAAFFEREGFEPLRASFLAFLLLSLAAVEVFAVAIAGYGAGVVPGLVASVIAWVFLFLPLALIFILVAGAFAAVASMVGAIRKLGARLWRKRAPAGADANPYSAGPAPGNPKKRRLVDWPEHRVDRRIVLSLCALTLVTFPYMAFVTAPMEPAELWVERWFWSLGLLDAIESRSKVLPIATWQWLVGSLALVTIVNGMSGLGAFRAFRRRFICAERSGPIAIAHAHRLPASEAFAVLKRRAPQLKNDLSKRESDLSKLRAAEALAEDGKAMAASFSRLLRALAREAVEIAARLPEDAPEGQELLERAARTSPEAALELARLIGQKEPERIARLLGLHADQPGWRLRRRIRRQLTRLAEGR